MKADSRVVMMSLKAIDNANELIGIIRDNYGLKASWQPADVYYQMAWITDLGMNAFSRGFWISALQPILHDLKLKLATSAL